VEISQEDFMSLSLYSISAEIITNDLRCIHQFTNFSGCQAAGLGSLFTFCYLLYQAPLSPHSFYYLFSSTFCFHS
jgi:hypothetical protein